MNLIYNDYDLNGDKVVSVKLDSSLWEPFEKVRIRPDPLLSSFQINNDSYYKVSPTTKTEALLQDKDKKSFFAAFILLEA